MSQLNLYRDRLAVAWRSQLPDWRLAPLLEYKRVAEQVIAWRDICRDQMQEIADAGRALAATRARRRVLERSVVELTDRLEVADRIGRHRGDQLIRVSRELADARNVIVELRKYIERENIAKAQDELTHPGPRLGPHNLPRDSK